LRIEEEEMKLYHVTAMTESLEKLSAKDSFFSWEDAIDQIKDWKKSGKKLKTAWVSEKDINGHEEVTEVDLNEE